jgi:hypothetical protein
MKFCARINYWVKTAAKKHIKSKMTPEPIEIIDYSFQQRVFKMYLYPLSKTPPDFADDLCDFYTLWNSLRDGDNIPLRKDINFEVLKGWHSNIRLVDLGIDKLAPKRKRQPSKNRLDRSALVKHR